MKAQTVLDLFRVSREDWLSQARHTAIDLLKKRPTITVEDVLALCPRPTYLHRNVTGSIFHDIAFKHTGFTRSKRAISNGRVIGIWRLSSDYHVPNFLAHKRRNMDEYGER